ALAAAFPLASADLPAPLPGDPPTEGGVLYGVNPDSQGVVWWDRWAQENHNSVVLARSGAGKSYFVKLEILRNLYQRVQVAVIDPEDEYLRLADAVGGTVVRLGMPGVKVNPFDLPTGDSRPDVLTRRGLFAHTLIAVLLGEQPPPVQRAALDRAILAAYRQAGITADPATHH
ncbi:helicase HerA domain-containing protein, partial [Micromonospora azadirachtae]